MNLLTYITLQMASIIRKDDVIVLEKNGKKHNVHHPNPAALMAYVQERTARTAAGEFPLDTPPFNAAQQHQQCIEKWGKEAARRLLFLERLNSYYSCIGNDSFVLQEGIVPNLSFNVNEFNIHFEDDYKWGFIFNSHIAPAFFQPGGVVHHITHDKKSFIILHDNGKFHAVLYKGTMSDELCRIIIKENLEILELNIVKRMTDAPKNVQIKAIIRWLKRKCDVID